MMHRTGIIFLSLIFMTCLFSCHKDKVNQKHPDMIGEWYHRTGDGLYYSISIFKNGRGYIYEKTAENDGLDTQSRAWIIKDDQLIFSRFKREKFSIDVYPTVASNAIIDNLDTILVGKTYMVLDGHYFVMKE